MSISRTAATIKQSEMATVNRDVKPAKQPDAQAASNRVDSFSLVSCASAGRATRHRVPAGRSAMEPLPTIDVPQVDQFPSFPPRHPPIAAITDYLLTRLLGGDSRTLYADFAKYAGCWYLQNRLREEPCTGVLIADLGNRSVLRMVLARFGFRVNWSFIRPNNCDGQTSKYIQNSYGCGRIRSASTSFSRLYLIQ